MITLKLPPNFCFLSKIFSSSVGFQSQGPIGEIHAKYMFGKSKNSKVKRILSQFVRNMYIFDTLSVTTKVLVDKGPNTLGVYI